VPCFALIANRSSFAFYRVLAMVFLLFEPFLIVSAEFFPMRFFG